MLKTAEIEPVFVGCNYREMEEGLDLQLSELTPGRRKAVRRKALRLISKGQGLERVADHLVPRPLQQGSTGWEPPTRPSLTQMLQRPPETPRCSICRMAWGRKRSFPSYAAAKQMYESQKDAELVVYACPAGEGGFHLGHRPRNPATSSCPATTTAQRREPDPLVNSNVESMLPNPLHKESLMKMQASLANPFLVALYSTALLCIGAGVGVHFTHALPTALRCCVAGGILMAAHDLATGFCFIWLTAKWVRSVIPRDKRG